MSIYAYIATMALTTYLIRMLPLTLLRKPIKSRFIRSFLHYVPYACLTAMTFPAILYATDHLISGALGLVITVTVMLSIKGLSPTVAISTILIAQLLVAAMIDGFGWMGQEKISMNAKQFAGLALMLGGVVLFKWK